MGSLGLIDKANMWLLVGALLLPGALAIDWNGQCVRDSWQEVLPVFAGVLDWNSPTNCAMLCLVRGNAFAGVGNGNECWCGDSAAEERVTADSECSSPCTGDPNQICGGPWRLNVFPVAGDSSRGYVPGSPGAAWTEEEVRVVQEKVRLMIHPDKADSLYKWNPRFPDIVNEVYGMVWKPEDPSNKHWYNHSFVMDFTVDEENHPRGCNIPHVYPECEWGTDPNCEYNKLPIKCGRTNFKLPVESQSSADIVEEF